jgi:glycosyltransferase involved in cell wall biosynthesis
MRVLHVLLSISTQYGGPPVAVRNLTEALAEIGVTGRVVTLGQRNSGNIEFAESVQVRNLGLAAMPKLGLPLKGPLLASLLEEARFADLVHLHDMWHLPQLAGAIVAGLCNRPYVVSPHGALEPWCLEQHRILKAIAWRSYQKRILDEAKRVHTLTEAERRTVQRLGVRSPTSVVPSGVNLRSIDETRERALAENETENRRETPFILYVGRLDLKKQLDVLLESFFEVAMVNKEIGLVIAGPDPHGLWADLKKRVERFGLCNRVRYLGFVDELMKFGLMSSAELFVQPSHTEGLSMAILEAMACGTPVIVSRDCNVPEVEEFRAGFVVSGTSPDFSRAITDALGDDALRKLMRQNARRLVTEKFTARAMANAMKKVYEECLAQPKLA